MIKDYKITTFTDLLQIPTERRELCVREILYALSMADLVGVESSLRSFDWTDEAARRAFLRGTEAQE